MATRYFLAALSFTTIILWAIDKWTTNGEHLRIFVRSLRQLGYV